MLESEGAAAAAAAVFGKREERLHDAKVEVEFFYGRQGPTDSFGSALKGGTYRLGGSEVTCRRWSAIFS